MFEQQEPSGQVIWLLLHFLLISVGILVGVVEIGFEMHCSVDPKYSHVCVPEQQVLPHGYLQVTA